MTVSSALSSSSSAIGGSGQSEATVVVAGDSLASSALSSPPLPPPPPPPASASTVTSIAIGGSITSAATNRTSSIKITTTGGNQSSQSAVKQLPELASVRINCKPKVLQNSKIATQITILNTTGQQQQQVQSGGFPKTRALAGSNINQPTQLWGRNNVNSLHHPHLHHHHHHHHHLHHHHPHHTQLRHVTSSAPYSLTTTHSSSISYPISEEEEDEGFNEEAASTTSSSSSSNADLNTPNQTASSPVTDPEESPVNGSADESSEHLQYNPKRDQNEDEPLPSIQHLTINHQHPSTSSASCSVPHDMTLPCCDTASTFRAMMHGSDDEDDLGAGNGEHNGHSSPASLIIKGPTGSVRGKRNIVRKSINNYTQLVKQANLEKGKQERDFRKEERHKCVLYLTTLGIIRKTFDESKQIKAILKNHFIDYDERDVYINEEFKKELRLRMTGDVVGFKVPVLYVNGHMLGGFTEIEKLNESGQLLQLLDRFRRSNRLSLAEPTDQDTDCSLSSRSSTDSHPSSMTSSIRSGSQNLHPLYQADCGRCGGTRFVNCDKCFGSRKTYIHHFDYASVSLKCSRCKKTGLVRCPDCMDA